MSRASYIQVDAYPAFLKSVMHACGVKLPRMWADRGRDGVDGSDGGIAQQRLELGEDLFDRVQVGEYLGKKIGRRVTSAIA